ncbi:MAG TPA: hypothetical protein DIU37_05000 [Opitutae bacterium]|nr:hypothetical protein [Opitutae bacterium]
MSIVEKSLERPIRIVVVDDDEVFCESLTKVLKPHDMHVLRSENLMDAGRMVQEEGAELLLVASDSMERWGVHHMDEIARDYPGLRIVLTASGGSVHCNVGGWRRGAWGCLVKFFPKHYWVQVLQSALSVFVVGGLVVGGIVAHVRL